MPWVSLSSSSSTGGSVLWPVDTTSNYTPTSTCGTLAQYFHTTGNSFFVWVDQSSVATPTYLQQAAYRQQAQNAMNQQQLARHAAVRQESPRVDPAAQTRARELLMENLNAEQRESYERHGLFVVRGGLTGTKYELHGDTVIANIRVLGARNRVTHRLCAHCSHDIPMGDQLLAQKLMLEYSEGEFLEIANRHAA